MFNFRKQYIAVDDIEKLLTKENIPILTLDHRWHSLFEQTGKTGKIENFEEKLNDLLKEQGKAHNQIKKKKLLKKELLEKIVTLSAEVHQRNIPDGQENIEIYKNEVERLNDEIEEIHYRLNVLPDEIKVANNRLFSVGIEEFYKGMNDSKKRIEKLNETILSLREKIKEAVVEKDAYEEQTEAVYSLMHNVLGPDIIEKIDKICGED